MRGPSKTAELSRVPLQDSAALVGQDLWLIAAPEGIHNLAVLLLAHHRLQFLANLVLNLLIERPFAGIRALRGANDVEPGFEFNDRYFSFFQSKHRLFELWREDLAFLLAEPHAAARFAVAHVEFIDQLGEVLATPGASHQPVGVFLGIGLRFKAIHANEEVLPLEPVTSHELVA